MSRWARALGNLAITVLVGGIYLHFFGLQTFVSVEARFVATKMPVVNRVPVELQDLSISQAPGKKLACFGYEFEIPWDDIDEAKSRTVGENKAIIFFKSGNALSMVISPPLQLVNKVFSSGNVDQNTFRQIYGDEALQSDYAFRHIMMETTPDRITPFISRRDAVSRAMLLLWKGISAPTSAVSGVFSVRAGEFTGFQYGHPPNPDGVSIELFADNGSLDFIFDQKMIGPTVVISQPDVNRVLHTLRKATSGTVANVGSSN